MTATDCFQSFSVIRLLQCYLHPLTVMSAPAPELPIEIWEQILSYLPNTFTATLYAINSPLLHLALNLRYRVAMIDGSAIERSLLYVFVDLVTEN